MRMKIILCVNWFDDFLVRDVWIIWIELMTCKRDMNVLPRNFVNLDELVAYQIRIQSDYWRWLTYRHVFGEISWNFNILQSNLSNVGMILADRKFDDSTERWAEQRRQSKQHGHTKVQHKNRLQPYIIESKQKCRVSETEMGD